MTVPHAALVALLGILIAAASSAGVGSERKTGVYCPVSGEAVVAGTSDEGAVLGTAECTERFRRFVATTVGEVRATYKLFFEDLGADPRRIDGVSRLIAREQLLSTGWVSQSSLSHGQSATDAKLLQETDAALRSLLTEQDFAALRRYQQTLPTRELLEPVLSRLDSDGVPPTRENLERAVADVHAWSLKLVDRTRENGGDQVKSCEQAEAFMSRREAQLLAILSRSLNEQQVSIARTYYQERAEQREKETADRVKATGKPCALREF